jgi:cytochrome c oxidase subunit 2
MAGSAPAAAAHLLAVTDTRQNYDDLFSIYWPVGLGVGVVIWVVTIVFLVRYRAGAAAVRPRRQRSESTLEYGYAALLVCVAAVLVAITFRFMSDDPADTHPATLAGAKVSPGAQSVNVRTTAAKWRWRFDYPDLGITQTSVGRAPARLVVPAGVPVQFEQTSIDVIHAFWIPELRFKKDAFPGRVHHFVLEFPKPGLLSGGKCAEFCGLDHSYMTFTVRVLPPAEFRAWAAANRGSGQ